MIPIMRTTAFHPPSLRMVDTWSFRSGKVRIVSFSSPPLFVNFPLESLFMYIRIGTDPNYKILYKDLWEPYGYPIALIDNFDNEYGFIDNDVSNERGVGERYRREREKWRDSIA